MLQQIPRLEYWAEMDVWNLTGNCSDLSDLPSVDFIIGSDTYSVPPSQWVTEVRLLGWLHACHVRCLPAL